MSDFKAALAARKAALATPESETLQVTVGDLVVVLRFHELPSTEWTAITAKNPPRVEVPLDMNYGYDWHASSDAAARVSVVRVEDDADVPFDVVDASDGVEPVNEWSDLVSVLSSPDLTQVRNIVWELNEFRPGVRTEKAKKALAAKQRRKSS